jgi:hypothetical protein
MACQTFMILLRLQKRSNTFASSRNVCCLAASGTLERRQRLKIASEEPRDEAKSPSYYYFGTNSQLAHTENYAAVLNERASGIRSEWLYILRNIYYRAWWSIIRQRGAVIQKRIAQVIECPPRSSLTLLIWLGGACVPLLSVYLCVRVNN